MISKIFDNCFDSIGLKSADEVFPLSVVHSYIKMKGVIISMVQLLFHKKCVAKLSDEKLQGYIHIQLVPFPVGLFSEEYASYMLPTISRDP